MYCNTILQSSASISSIIRPRHTCIYTICLLVQTLKFAVYSACTVYQCCSPEYMQRVLICAPHSFPQCLCLQHRQPVCLNNTINTQDIVRCNNTLCDLLCFSFIPSHLPCSVQHSSSCTCLSPSQPLSQAFSSFLPFNRPPPTPSSSLCGCCPHASLLNCN